MKPILFSTPMVKAILDSRKTMTRRVIKNPPWGMHNWDYDEDGGFEARCGNGGAGGIFLDWNEPLKPPYKPGDILYVRETWCPCATIDSWLDDVNLYGYKADFPDDFKASWKWRPSIHMPKEAARIFLKVKDVRIERVQDISVQDAKDEGIKSYVNDCPDGIPFGCYNGDDCVFNRCTQPIEYFKELWNTLNVKRGYDWDDNPWVWVVEFEKIERPKDE